MLGIASFALPVAALLGAGGPSATTISFELRLNVPVSCTIESIAPMPENPRALRVATTCNAENMNIAFGGALAGHQITQVTAGAFAASSHGANSVMLRQLKPGRGELEVVFDKPIDALTSNSVSLAGY